MATAKRVWLPGMIYHITARGNRKDVIFRDDEDYIEYLSLVKEAMEYYKEYHYQLICYCLMTNHIHILLKCNYWNPSYIMRRINSRYAKYFNNKYDYVGHLFQERYYAEVITNTNHLLETSKYIHMNPVKANMVRLPEEYRWSSYNVYKSYRKNKNNIVGVNSTTDIINIKRNNRRNGDYEEFEIKQSDIFTQEILQYFDTVKKYGEYVIM